MLEYFNLNISTLFLMIFTYFGLSASVEIPSYINICKRSDPKVEQCIINSVEALRSKLRDGLPELNVEPLDPMFIPHVDITQIPGFTCTGYNITVHGGGDFQIKNLKLKQNDKEMLIDVDIFIPALNMEGNYHVNGKILVLNLNGDGPFFINTTNTEGKAHLVGEIKNVDGKEYLYWTDLELRIKIGEYKIKLENMFDGNKNLGDTINLIVNENKKQMSRTLAPIVQKVVSDILLDSATKISSIYPLDVIFPK